LGNSLRIFLRQNLNAAVFLLGLVVFFVGLAHRALWLAETVVGALVMLLPLLPYLVMLRRKGKS
jgi:hypothetical protein